MDKTSMLNALTNNHSTFVSYLNALTDAEYAYSHQGKWTAGQQLEHIVLCVQPLVQVFSMDKAMIAQTFGQTDRPSLTYDALLAQYLDRLSEGGKAPNRFVPPNDLQSQRKALSDTLTQLVNALCAKIANFSEQELDTLLIPHPLLGNLTLREMLYNATYHVTHHQNQAIENLKQQTV